MDIGVFIVNRQAQRIRELNNASVGPITWGRNGVGKATFSLSSDDPDAPIIKTWDHEVQIYFDGEISWWGVIWDKRGTPGVAEWTAEDLLTLLWKRFITTTTALYTSIDQQAIAWDLVANYAQQPQGSEHDNKDLNIQVAGYGPSALFNRSREYRRDEHQNIYDILKEFIDLDVGFEYRIEYDTVNRVFTTFLATAGQYKPELKLEYGRNISDYTITESSRESWNDGYGMGGSAGDVRFEAHVTDHADADEHGLMTNVWSEGSELDAVWLNERATRKLKTAKGPQSNVDISSVSIPIDYFKIVKPSDRIFVRIEDGANAFVGFVIVETVTFNPASEGELKLEVSVINDPHDDPILSSIAYSPIDGSLIL